uniref:Uncharacterized protein n=1 Tax=Arcella intermedia TaxID=1963864 RepID=A0A6B2LEJ4_9EUKA
MNSLSGVQSLRASPGAVHDSVALVDSAFDFLQEFKPFLLGRVPGVDQPAVSLEEHSGSEVVLLAGPPVAGARGRAARAKDAFVEAVQLLAVISGLEDLLVLGLSGEVGDEPGLNGLVLGVEIVHVRNKISDDLHVGERIDSDPVFGVNSLSNLFQAGQSVRSCNIHSTTAANTFSARPSEGQGRVLFLQLDQGIQDHGSASFSIQSVNLDVRLTITRGIFTIVSVNFESNR